MLLFPLSNSFKMYILIFHCSVSYLDLYKRMTSTLSYIADQCYMYVSVNGCRLRKYNTMPYLHSYPVTVLLYGEILLLGMESGKQ
jgi:hypothetical protein